MKLKTDVHSSERSAALRLPLQVGLAVCILSLAVGCRSLKPSDGEGLFAGRDLLKIDRIRGPLERNLQKEEDVLAQGERFSPEALRQVESARQQFNDGNYRAAIKSYDAIASRYPESSIGEEAWFRMAEAHFELKEYPKAQDAYQKLFEDYPSTKYVATASERLFSIARTWLDITDPASGAASDVKTVSSESVAEAAPKRRREYSERFGMIPNFFDKSRPIFDTRGRAREALKSIWLNDPTGPLADDALMLTASFHLRNGDYMEADRYFEILREEYPSSPHVEDAYVLGSHVKQLSYQGPYYDGTTLVAAENLKERTLTMFPNSGDRQKVREDLDRIYSLRAQRAWSQVELWKRKENPRAIAIQAMQLITEFPDTRYAQMARRELQAIDPALLQDLPGVAEFMSSLPPAGADTVDSESDSTGRSLQPPGI